jgi:hypothetical protein
VVSKMSLSLQADYFLLERRATGIRVGSPPGGG